MATPGASEARPAEAPPRPGRENYDPASAEAQSAEILSSVVGQIFSTRRPRDVCAGAASAAKSVAKGVALGVAALVAAPAAVAYAREPEDPANPHHGGAPPPGNDNAPPRTALAKLSGVAAGLGAGLAGALLLPLAGALVGMVQVIRGCWNTPSAVYHACAGDLAWDADEREWKEKRAYVLSEEVAAVRAEAEAEGVEVPQALLAAGGGGAAGGGAAAARRPARRVASLEYYDLLGIATDAEGPAIKKAYYRKARSCHPDKCGDDPEAAAAFQRLSHAYQVLSDPQLRAAYDRDGADATADVGFQYDAAVFFNALFGSQRFEPWVGELALAQISQTLTKRGGAADAAARAMRRRDGQPDEPGGETERELSKAVGLGLHEIRSHGDVKQRGREVALATGLAAALEPFVRGDEAAFGAWAASEARDLAAADSEGLTRGALVLALARGYAGGADEWLWRLDTPLGLGGAVAAARQDVHANLAYASAATAGARGLYAAKKLADSSESPETAAAAAAAAATAPASREDLEALGAGALKRLARAHEVDVDGCVEKAHLVDALRTAKAPLPDDHPKRLLAAEARTPEAQMKDAMPVFLDAMLRVSLVDVHETLRKVVARVLADEAVSLDDRRKRAAALRAFAAALRKAKAEAGAAPKTSKDAEATAKRFEHAMNVTMAAAMGQEMSDDHGRAPPPEEEAGDPGF